MTFDDTEWKPVEGSANIKALRWFPELELLDVEYPNGKYRYYGVDDVSTLKSPESAGKAVRDLIKGLNYEKL